MAISKQVSSELFLPPKIRSYHEVVEYLDAHWQSEVNNLDAMRQLDTALGNPSKKIRAIIIGGTNGKSITLGLAAKLLKEEGLSVGTFSSPHILTYNERIATQLAAISNKSFTDHANDVINTAEAEGITVHSAEILTMIALRFFVEKEVDVALLEAHSGGTYDPVNICTARVASVTRITSDDEHDDTIAQVTKCMGMVSKGTWFVSGDQCKAHLEHMQNLTEKQGGNWAMPIRKLVPLAYPYEQLHGRCAALAERITQMFMKHVYNKDAHITADTLLSRKQGKRGRPTLEEKRQAERRATKTLDQFWKEELNEMPGRFELLEREKPRVLLDTASNLDAFENLTLGVRLLHYKDHLKGLAVIMAAPQDGIYSDEFLKMARYFFKKTSGEIFICPLESPVPGTHEEGSWNVEKVTNALKSLRIRAHACNSFNQAFEAALDTVDKKEGMICITGSRSVIAAYWRNKGIKTF